MHTDLECEHEYFILNTNLVLFVFKKCRRQKSVSEIRVLKIIRVIRVIRVIREIRVQKKYYPCSKNNILRVQKKLFFVFKIRNCCAARKRAAQP